MKIQSSKHPGHPAAMTLIELTVVIAVLLGLVAVSLVAAGKYASAAKRTGCIMNQDMLRKTIRSNANLTQTPLQPGIDYYLDPSTKNLFDMPVTCPEAAGPYSCLLAADGHTLIITCLEHQDSHQP